MVALFSLLFFDNDNASSSNIERRMYLIIISIIGFFDVIFICSALLSCKLFPIHDVQNCNHRLKDLNFLLNPAL